MDCAADVERVPVYVGEDRATSRRNSQRREGIFYENLQEIPGLSFVYARTHNTEFLRGILRPSS